MKYKLRLWTLLLAILLLALAAILPSAADAPMTGDIWSIYVLTETEQGMPSYGIPPNHRYTDAGLLIEPTGGTQYTVQTDHAYSLDDGFFMEICLEDTEAFTNHDQIVFHLWDQVGMIVGSTRSGSGWYGVTSAIGTDTHYMISITDRAATDGQEGESQLHGAMKLTPKFSEDGKCVYTVAAKDGVLYVNGQEVKGSADIVAFLRRQSPDGKIHVGFTVMTTQEHPLSGVTVTRFGRTANTAVIPGTNTVPETDPSDDPTDDPSGDAPSGDDPAGDTPTGDSPSGDEPADTDAPSQNPSETQPPAGSDGTNPDGTSPDGTSPGGSDKETGSSDPAPDGSSGKDPSGAPGGTTETESELSDGMAKDTLDFINRINVFDNCKSSLSLGGLASLAALLAAAAFSFRKKD